MKNSFPSVLRAGVAAAILTLAAGTASATVNLVSSDDLTSVFTNSNFDLGFGADVGIRSVTLTTGTTSVTSFAFCIEPTVELSPISNFYSAGTASLKTGVAALYATSYASVIASYQANKSDLTGVAAFQLALWELQNDNGNLASGKLSFTGAYEASQVEVLAAGDMLKLASGYKGPSTYTFTALTSANEGFESQTLLTVSAVPEPGTYAMLLAGLGLVGFMARRRKAA